MQTLRLFALTVQEGELLAHSLSGSPGSDVLKAHLLKGGFEPYTGSVTDQDGDASWQITASFRTAKLWARQMSAVSFQKPQIYRIDVRRNGFGREHRLDWQNV